MFSLKVALSDGFSILIWLFGTSLFVMELSRIGVCRLFLTDRAVSLKKMELISDEFILCNWFCEGSWCILSITLRFHYVVVDREVSGRFFFSLISFIADRIKGAKCK